MSGFEGRTGWYGLTGTKFKYWHRYNTTCGATDWDDEIQRHLLDNGFTVEDNGSWLRVTGPGLVDGWTADLYLAVSGADPARADRSEERRWRH